MTCDQNLPLDTSETLSELRLHYTTIGKPERDASGKVVNAVLILHGTGGTGQGFLRVEIRSTDLRGS